MQHTHTSSIGSEEYFEEPLSEDSTQYEPALQTSNKVVELVKAGELEKIYAFASPKFQNDVGQEDFTSLLKSLLVSHGGVVEFKPMQWAFTTKIKGGKEHFYSSKIVVHSSAQFFYHFQFDPTGDYQKFRGLHISLRQDQGTVHHSVGKLRHN